MNLPLNPMKIPLNPINLRLNPMKIPLNPMNLPLNPMKIPLNPMNLPLNPMNLPLNPMNLPWNPMKIPFFNSSNLVTPSFSTPLGDPSGRWLLESAAAGSPKSWWQQKTFRAWNRLKRGWWSMGIWILIYIYYILLRIWHIMTYHEYTPHSESHTWMRIEFGSLRINMGDFIVKRYGKFNQRVPYIFHRPISCHRDIPSGNGWHSYWTWP